MCWICITGGEHLRECWRMKMSKKIPTAGVPTRSVGKNCGKSPESAVWNLRLCLGQRMQEVRFRDIEWPPRKKSPPTFGVVEDVLEEYGPWLWAAAFGRATGRFGADAFILQEDGKLRCPAGASLWLSEVRQENAFTRACRLSGLSDRLSALCAAGTMPGKRRPKGIAPGGSVRSVVSCLHLRLGLLSACRVCSDRSAGRM